MLRDEYEHIDCAAILDYIPDEDEFDATMHLVYRQVLQSQASEVTHQTMQANLHGA